MTAPMTCHFVLSRAALAGALAAFAVLIGPAGAHKDPVTQQQLTAYEQVFMEQVRKGDLLFHGDAATEKAMGVVLSNTGMACAMCHPMTADTHPATFPKYQAQMAKFATLRDMINWCIENPVRGKPFPDDDPKLKALEAYILAQRKGIALDYGKH